MSEYGATIGRPRRMGWFDVVATKYGCRLQCTTQVALSLLDVLGYLKEIPICSAYEVNGTIITDFPPTQILEQAKHILEYLPGWDTDISHIRNYNNLPQEAKNYISYIEEKIEFSIKYISVGPERDSIIFK